MIAKRTSRLSRGGVSISLAAAVFFPLLCAAQTKPPVGINTGIQANPRGTTDDPRYGLKPGLYDAGEAVFGMQRISSLPKPPGFAPGTAAVQVPAGPGGGQYGSWNTDLAFNGNHLFVGNYNGISFYDIDNPSEIKLQTALICPGGQGDVSVYGHLLFMSAESLNARTDCGAQGIPPPPGYVPPPPPPPAEPVAPGAAPARARRPPPPPSPDRFRGVRIFDISDLSNPKQVAAVQSCRGSHTHTLLTDPKDKDNIYIYISGTGNVRQTEEMAECSAGDPSTNPNTALFRIDIIKVPLAHPEQAKIVSSPRIFADTKTGAINGLWKGGNYGDGSQTSSETSRCHDITVYSAVGLAAGACSGNGILLDISNPANPVRLDAVSDPNYAFWHSATFNNAGTKVLFTDEWGGGIQARCRGTDPMSWGADALFTLSKRKLTPASYYKMPVPQPDDMNCVAHNGNLIPVPGRDIMVQAWYAGGISIMDFTDTAHPVEIGYFARGPVEKGKIVMSGVWSVYWYNGFIYSSEIARGVDVFKLAPSKFLTQNEIDASNQVHFDELNVQNQPKMTWPANFVVARAYIDQLARGTAVTPQRIATLNTAIAKVEASNPDRKDVAQLKAMGVSLNKDAAAAKTSADAERMRALAAILKQGGTSRL